MTRRYQGILTHGQDSPNQNQVKCSHSLLYLRLHQLKKDSTRVLLQKEWHPSGHKRIFAMAGAAVAHGRASPVCVTTLPGRVAGVGLRAQAQGHFPEGRAEIWCIILILFRSSSFQSDTIEPRDLQKLNCCACCAFETFKPTRRHRPNRSWRFMGILTWDVSRTARREVIICNCS